MASPPNRPHTFGGSNPVPQSPTSPRASSCPRIPQPTSSAMAPIRQEPTQQVQPGSGTGLPSPADSVDKSQEDATADHQGQSNGVDPPLFPSSSTEGTIYPPLLAQVEERTQPLPPPQHDTAQSLFLAVEEPSQSSVVAVDGSTRSPTPSVPETAQSSPPVVEQTTQAPPPSVQKKIQPLKLWGPHVYTEQAHIKRATVVNVHLYPPPPGVANAQMREHLRATRKENEVYEQARREGPREPDRLALPYKPRGCKTRPHGPPRFRLNKPSPSKPPPPVVPDPRAREDATRSTRPPARQRATHSRPIPPRAPQPGRQAKRNYGVISTAPSLDREEVEVDAPPPPAAPRKRARKGEKGSATAISGAQTARTVPKPTKESKTKQEDDKFWTVEDLSPPTSNLDGHPVSYLVDCVEHLTCPRRDLKEPDPHTQLLHPAEAFLAGTLSFTAAKYLTQKRKIFLQLVENKRQGKGFTKTHAQQACGVDVNKASKLFEAFKGVGWFDEKLFQAHLGTASSSSANTTTTAHA